MPHVLLVDDEPAQRHAMLKTLEGSDIRVTEAGSVDEAVFALDSHQFDLIITELKLPGESGRSLITRSGSVPTIVTTTYASLKSAVEVMKLGAVDYLAKPCAPEALMDAVQQALGQASYFSSDDQSAPDNKQHSVFEGRCESIRQLRRDIDKVAQTDSTVLILGETGTGKELTARSVHERSQRAGTRMVAVNCAAIPDTLIESELFGYEKGAFTGANTNRVGLIEAADGGTLFLDEIGELPLPAQARLLRFIQEGEIRRIGSVTSKKVDVRLICATHRDLATLSRRNEFRQDLYYRINVLRLEIPALRERGDDLLALADWFAVQLAIKMNLAPKPLSDSARRAIVRYSWPGNVRELEHAIERGCVMAEGDEITESDIGLSHPAVIPPRMPSPAAEVWDKNVAAQQAATEGNLTVADVPTPAEVVAEELSLEDYFQRFVLEHQDSMSETELAQKLGISRKCLWERRQRFDLPRKKSSRRRSA
jgi:DNA-binding NtrC family response regulator